MELRKEIEKTFPLIEKALTQEYLVYLKGTPINDLYLHHFGLGLWIRNNLLHPKNSVLYNLFLENGIEHQDDMSHHIIELFHSHITRETRALD